MRKINFLSKSSSQSGGHSSVTLAMTVGSPSAHRRETMLRLLSVLVLIFTFGIGQMWAVDPVSTLTFTAKCNGSGTADDGAVWTVTSDGSESNYDGTKGIHYGTSSAQVEYIQLSTSDISGNITQVVVNASTASGVTASVSVSVDGSAFTTTSDATSANLSTSATNYTFTGSGSGEIIVRIAKPTKANNALYCKSIAVTYSPKATVTYNANGATTGNVPTDNTEYNPNATVTVLGNTGNLERTGCTFAGWNTKADGTGTNYAADATFNISANTTLYAKWTATVTWKANNVTVKTDDIVVPADGKTVELPTTEQIGANKCGDRIMGWTESENHKANTAPADLFTDAPTVQGSKTYYAVFADYAE